MIPYNNINVNKSHAASYAVVAYDTAYLMRYYPTEFIAAMLNSIIGANEKVAYYIRFAKEIGIELMPPDINECFAKFTVKGEKIYFGLASVKNVGVSVIESIVNSRRQKGKFINFVDFCNKIDTSVVNKRAVESLIKAGALDCFNVYRSKLLAVYEKILDGVGNQRKKNIRGQLNLFTDFAEQEYEAVDIKYPDIKEFEKRYILSMEKEMTGLYISGHPLEEFEETLKASVNTKISDIIGEQTLDNETIDENYKIQDGDRVIIGGIVTEVSKKITKNNAMMAFIKLEDMYGEIEIIIFPKVLERCISFVNEDAMLIVKGRVSIREDEQPKLLCEEIKPLVKINNDKIYIQVEAEKTVKPVINEMKEILLNYNGTTPIYICTKKERRKFVLPSSLWVNEDIELLEFLREKFGGENVKIIE